MFDQIKSQNLSEMVVDHIIELIETRKLKPGDKLPAENVFAEQLGVSRGILREALIILQFQGFINRKPKDGTYIRGLDDTNKINQSITQSLKYATYKDLIELREPLEVKTVELAIERAKDEEINEIKEYINSIDVDDENYRIMDYNFHSKITELSQNILLINFTDNYYGLIEEIGAKSSNKRERRIEIIEEHKDIINAISERDKEKARQATIYHLRRVREIIEESKFGEEIHFE